MNGEKKIKNKKCTPLSEPRTLPLLTPPVCTAELFRSGEEQLVHGYFLYLGTGSLLVLQPSLSKKAGRHVFPEPWISVDILI